MDQILAQDDRIDLKINSSIAELDRFIESQTSSLARLRDGVAIIEELKQRTVDQPTAALNIILSEGRDELRFSRACMELDAGIPDIDWSLVRVADRECTGLAGKETSRASRLRGHIAELQQALTALPPLPVTLLNNEVEDKSRKRRRTDSTGPSLLPTTSSSSLRLPNSATQHATTIISPNTTPHPQPSFTSTPSPTTNSLHSISPATTTLGAVPQLYADPSYPERRPWASKGLSMVEPTQTCTDSPPSPVVTKPEPIEIKGDAEEVMDGIELDQGPSTFKQNWTLAEQHMLERLLNEIPSTVKFRWVRISEAMGGTRTPRQVASRVQKYYQKMKKLGVAVDSADMGGGGRGGSKATQDLDMPGITRGRGSSTRGKPKTGPQYTKSGRRR